MGNSLVKNTGKDRIYNSTGMTPASVSSMITAATVGLFDYRGVHDASTNLFPSTGGSGTAGAILKSDTWRISVGGTLGTEVVNAGDFVIALVDTPGTTASNWSIWQGETNNDLGYNVRDYGLKGDGSTNDQAALNTLLNTTAATGSTIYFPPGTYNLGAVTTVSNKYFHFVGNQATLAMTANTQILDMSSTVALTGAGARWTFEGLAFNGTGAGAAQSGLYFSNFSGLFTISDCLFTNWGNTGIAIASTQNASTAQAGSLGGLITGCRFYNNVKGINLLDRGEYIQIIGNQFLANTTAIYTIGGNSIIDGNTISYNVTGIEISTGTNSGKDIISNNHLTHNSTYSINAHDIASTQGLSILDNHIILGTLRIESTTGVTVSGGLINSDAYDFDTNTGLTFIGVKFNTTLANTITLVGDKPNYVGCFNFNGDGAIDADNFTPAALLINNGNVAKPILVCQDNGSTVFNIADGGAITTGTWNASTIAAIYGGTGNSSYTIGDLLMADSTTTLTKLLAPATGSYLRGAGAGNPLTWSVLALPNSATTRTIMFATSANTIGESTTFVFDANGCLCVGKTSAASADAVVDVLRTVAATARVGLQNASTANGAYAQMTVQNSATTVSMGVVGTATTTSGIYVQAEAYIVGTSAGLNIGTSNASGVIRLYGGSAVLSCFIDASSHLNMADAKNIILNTGTGTKIGTATTQKLAFYNATPIVQGASIADASGGAVIDAEARTAINTLISRIEALGLIATV